MPTSIQRTTPKPGEGATGLGRRRGPSAERILREAAKLIAVNGFAATSTRDIADAVGIRQPGIYKHFESKDAILGALFRLALKRPTDLAAQLAHMEGPAAPPAVPPPPRVLPRRRQSALPARLARPDP